MNEPAFPTPKHTTNLDCARHEGMTLRDYFASKALIGIIIETVLEPKFSAEQAYRYADAMLEARKAT